MGKVVWLTVWASEPDLGFSLNFLTYWLRTLIKFYKLSVPLFLIGKIPIEDYIEVIHIKGLLA